MSKSLGLKQIMLVLIPLILIVLGVLYFEEGLTLLGLRDAADSGHPVSSKPVASQHQPENNSTAEPEDESTNSTDGLGVTSQANTPLDPGTESTLVGALPFLPSGLKDLRDPFQSMIKQAETLAQAIEATNSNDVQKSSPEQQVPLIPEEVAQPDKQDITHEELITTVPEVTDLIPVEPPVKPVIQYPPFELKGLVSQEGRQKAILTVKGQSYIVNAEDRVQDWQIIKIDKSSVYLQNQDGQGFRMTLEGVTIDEEIEETTE